jgi:hypothetical protein
MREINKKIDEKIDILYQKMMNTGHDDIKYDAYMTRIKEIQWIKEIILSSQKEPHHAADNNVATKTIGDKIRESNESLAEYISKFTILADRQRIIDYLNQPYVE